MADPPLHVPATLARRVGIIGGAGWLTFLSPTLGYVVFDLVAPLALLGSVLTIGWLFVKGVDEERWMALEAGLG